LASDDLTSRRRDWSTAELEAEIERLERSLRDRLTAAGEVSFRATTALLDVFDAELGRGLVTRAIEEAGLSRSRFDGHQADWLPWSEYEDLLTALEPITSGDLARRLGEKVMDSPLLRFLLQSVRALARLEISLRWSSRVAFGPGGLLFRGCEASVRRVGRHHVEARFAPPLGATFPRIFVDMAHGALGRFADLAGADREHIETWQDGATLLFRFEQEALSVGRLKALVALGFDSLGSALDEARAELAMRNRELRRRIAEHEADEREHERLRLRLAARRDQEAISRLASGVAHDFNNLVGAMVLQLEMLQPTFADDEDVRVELAATLDAAEQAAHHAKELLALGRGLRRERSDAVEPDNVSLEGGLLDGGAIIASEREALEAQIDALTSELAGTDQQDALETASPSRGEATAARGVAAVSWRNVTATVAAAERLGIDANRLAAGMSWSFQEARKPDDWISWPEFNELLAKIGDLAGPDGLRALGEQALSSPLFQVVGAVAGAFVDEEALFAWTMRVAFRPEGLYFTGIEGRVESHGPRELRVIWESRGAELSQAFALAMAGITENAPRMVGRPPARVEVELEPDRIVLHVTLAPRASWLGTALEAVGRRRLADQAEELRELYTELVEQNQLLAEQMDQLERSRRRRRALERRLELIQPMDAVGRVAAKVAHDFNNLLTVILAHVELARLNLSDDDPRQEGLDTLVDVAVRATALTRKLRIIGRGEPERGQPVNVVPQVERLVPILHGILQDGAELELELATFERAVPVDGDALDRILVNLVVNARDAAAKRVQISAEEVSLDEAFTKEHPGARCGPHILISVRDDGAGMPQEVRARVFEPYFTTKEGGSGVGLSTVYGVVRAAEGTIWLDSEPGRGTTFRIFLPAVAPTADVPAEAEDHRGVSSPAQARSGDDPTLLVIDDDDALRSILIRVVQSGGYDVVAARSGDEALRLVDEGLRPAMVVTDVVMPGIRGARLAEALRRSLGPVPILFISGYSDEPLDLGSGVSFLAKPFSREKLLSVVAEMLEEA